MAQFISLKGDRELQRIFAAMPKESAKALRKGMRVAAKRVLVSARLRVPVDSGALKKSLKVRAVKSKNRGQIQIGVVSRGDDLTKSQKKKAEKQGALFAGKTYYGAFVEFGAKGQAAQPFMRPAVDENVSLVEFDVASAIKSVKF